MASLYRRKDGRANGNMTLLTVSEAIWTRFYFLEPTENCVKIMLYVALISDTKRRMKMTDQLLSYEWIDWPDEGYFGAEWGMEHTLGCAFAFLFIIPGIIFLAVKSNSRERYLQRKAETEKKPRNCTSEDRLLILT